MHSVFEILRERFAHSIHQIHPDDDLPYIIHTDASGKAIAVVLMLTKEDGGTRLVPTASRVLTLVEQRYSTCEQELLAIVYALQKFRIYVFGHKIMLYTGNKFLSFLHKFALTSNRIARWVIELLQYDIQIHHITGSSNYLADVLSRNPAGLKENELRDLRQPDNFVVNAINLNIDPCVTHELKDLAARQSANQRLARIKEILNKYPNQVDPKYKLLNGILYSIDQKHHPFWRPMLPSTLNNPVIKYVHTSLGHLGVDKCMDQVAHSFHIKNLGRKIRKFIARCNTCQRVKYPNKSYTTKDRTHLSAKSGGLCALELFGALPVARGGVTYILVCYDVFSKHVKLYTLKAATTRSCLNKLLNHYFTQVIKPKCILSDNGTQIQSLSWRKYLAEHNVQVRFTPIRHSQANSSERCMREISKFCKIYCSRNHRKWAEQLPKREEWLNTTVAGSTGFTPVELLLEAKKPDLFENILTKSTENLPEPETVGDKFMKAYARMRRKARDRRERRKTGNKTREPKENEKVLVKAQPASDAAVGVTAKFIHPYEGPYIIIRVIPPSTYEISTTSGTVRGEFNKVSEALPRRKTSNAVGSN